MTGMALDCTIDRYSSPALLAAITTSSFRYRSADSLSSHLTVERNSSALYSSSLLSHKHVSSCQGRIYNLGCPRRGILSTYFEPKVRLSSILALSADKLKPLMHPNTRPVYTHIRAPATEKASVPTEGGNPGTYGCDAGPLPRPLPPPLPGPPPLPPLPLSSWPGPP